MDNIELNSLPKIIEAIKEGKISNGQNKEYCFFLDEDGDLTFLKRIPDSERDKDFSTEDLQYWPLNQSDEEVLFQTYCGEYRGTTITAVLLKIFGIEYQGL